MYTAVLMAALSTAPATSDWHRHGGCYGGCTGVTSSCYGCYGCAGGGYGPGGVGIPYGGSCIGTWGTYAVAGPNPAYGCWGAFGLNSSTTIYQGQGTYGYGLGAPGYGLPGYGLSFQCHGCYGCYGGWSCYGSPTASSLAASPIDSVGGMAPVVTPNPGGPTTAPVPAPIQETPLPKKEDARLRSKVTIEVPQNAKLYVDDILLKDGPTQRVFETPPLSPTETYFYDIRVEVAVDGKTLVNSQRLILRPGTTVTADMREPGRSEVLTASAPPK